MDKKKYILGIGAANIDLCGRSKQPMVMGAENSGSFSMSAGGVTRNICENAARMGAQVKLITVLGDDPFAAQIETQCAACGVDLTPSLRLAGERSATHLSIYDQNGAGAVSMSELSLLQRLTPAYLESQEEVIGGAAALVIDGGLPQAVVDYVLGQWGHLLPVFIDPASAAGAQKFAHTLVGCHTIKPSWQEAQVLAGMPIREEGELALAAETILALGAHRVVVTLGDHGAYFAQRGGDRKLFAPQQTRVVSTAGAGDAFTAGLLYGTLMGMVPQQVVEFAMTAAAITLATQDTIHQNLQEELQKCRMHPPERSQKFSESNK